MVKPFYDLLFVKLYLSQIKSNLSDLDFYCYYLRKQLPFIPGSYFCRIFRQNFFAAYMSYPSVCCAPSTVMYRTEADIRRCTDFCVRNIFFYCSIQTATTTDIYLRYKKTPPAKGEFFCHAVCPWNTA